jgi:hypothetical protein
MIGKRETSISVADLQDFHNVSDSIKRLAISIDGHPAKSHSSEAEDVGINTPRLNPSSTTGQAAGVHSEVPGVANGGGRGGYGAVGTSGNMPMHPPKPTGHIQSILSNARSDFSEKYELLNEIGRGGFSTVYQCRDRLNGTIYAVKVRVVVNEFLLSYSPCPTHCFDFY